MAANTEILIKRSLANTTPNALNQGELAYSYASNTLFIGTPGSDGYLEIGAWSDLTGLSAGSYGNTTTIPSITVDSHGKITSISNNTISTTLSIGADTGGPGSVDLLTGTLTVNGGEGIDSSVSGDTITLDVDDTVVRSNTAIAYQLIDGNLSISGNLNVLGTQTITNTETFNVIDPLIYLAANNYTDDIVDIGFVGNYYDADTDTQRHAGVMRHAGDKDFYIFYNYDKEPTSNVIDIGDASFLVGNTHTNVIGNLTGNVDASLVQSGGFLAAEGTSFNGADGYSFKGDGGFDTGMFSPVDGELQFYSNAEQIFTANTTVVFFEKDLKLQNFATINNPNGLLELNPDETNEDDRYIVIDPTAPNHIHLRAGGTIDDSTADLFLGGENNYVRVSDATANVEIKTNGANNWTFTNDGKLQLPNGTTISDADAGFYVDSLASDATPANVVFYNTTTKELTYGSLDDLNPDSINSGVYSWTVDNITGALYSDAGTYIGDSANSVVIGQNVDVTNANAGRVAIGDYAGSIVQEGFAVAIGANAGQTGQQWGATAIGTNAGTSNQGTVATAIGSNSGRYTQGQNAVAIGRRAGETTQGQYAVALGNRAGKFEQGQYSIAIGSLAGETSQGNNSIIFNASGSALDATTSGFFVDPVRYMVTQETDDALVFYNAASKEVRYAYALDGGSF